MSKARDLADGTFDTDLTVSGANPNIDVSDAGTSHASQDFLSNSSAVRATIGVEQSAGGGLFVGSSGYAAVFGTASAGSTQFATNNNIRMTLDSSGNLLVGKTSANTGTVGAEFRSDGLGVLGRSADYPLILNRTTSDGGILLLRKDGTTVGNLGAYTSSLYIGTPNRSNILFGTNAIVPVNNTGGNRDNAIDLGESSVRFDDIYATNGTIQTSDANEKQQIASLTDAEITAAKAISKLFKTFKWNDKVAEKGDAARTHAGVIAQDVAQAMTDAGLDAGNYAFFISTTWWETQTEVPAVAEELDEDGNVITEAQEAYTRTDTYDTLEEAPAGATERTRLGIRYPELLSFIGAATEQRLASIEARLDALEAV